MNNGRRVDVWLLDFGCSNHMCGDNSLFHVINEDYRYKVKMGNNMKMDVLEKQT